MTSEELAEEIRLIVEENKVRWRNRGEDVAITALDRLSDEIDLLLIREGIMSWVSEK
jgi:hypothetical protein